MVTAIDTVHVVMARKDLYQNGIPLHSLPDELLLHILWFLDIPDLYATSRVGSNPEPPKQCGRGLLTLPGVTSPASAFGAVVACSQAATVEAATADRSNILDENPYSGSYDRRSGEIVWGTGVAGALVERKRKVEREQIKEGLRVWLERKAREIRSRKNEGGVGTLVWRFSRKFRMGDPKGESSDWSEKPKREKVTGLKRFFEDLG